MKILYMFLAASFCLCGCASSSPRQTMSELATDNNSKLAMLSVGMTKDQALSAMGTMPVNALCWFWRKKVNNPSRTEILEGQGNKFEVLYYYTNTDDWGWGCDISDDDLTPLVFYEGKLIGWGQSFLRQLDVKYGII